MTRSPCDEGSAQICLERKAPNQLSLFSILKIASYCLGMVGLYQDAFAKEKARSIF